VLGVAAAFLKGNWNAGAIVQELLQLFGREFAAFA
jgi:hypothetical protein